MKPLKFFVTIAIISLYVSCTNNNHNTGGTDSASVSTDASMQGRNDTTTNSGMSSSDSTDVRMPMADTTHGTPGNQDSLHK